MNIDLHDANMVKLTGTPDLSITDIHVTEYLTGCDRTTVKESIISPEAIERYVIMYF